jgi:hypothetical protein
VQSSLHQLQKLVPGFLLHTEIDKYPETEGRLDPQFVENAQKAAREQINNFFNQ